MNKRLKLNIVIVVLLVFLNGCITSVYKPGAKDNPFNNIKLGQTYYDMVKVLGEPNHSRMEDRMVEETIILFIPLWGILEAIGDFNPSMLQIYTYDQWGTITIDNNNHIIRIEAK